MINTPAYSFEEYRLGKALRVFAFIFFVASFGYLLPALVGSNKDFFIHLPFVTNSVVKVAVMGILAFIASGDVRRFRVLTPFILIGHIISIVASLLVLIWGNAGVMLSFNLPWNDTVSFPVSRIIWGSVIADSVVVGIIWFLYAAAQKKRYNLLYLSAQQFRALVALSESLVIGKDQPVTPHEMATSVDQYLASFRAKTKWIFKLVLTGMQIYPLLSFHVPLSSMDPAERKRFLEDRFYKRLSAKPLFFRDLIRVMIRISKQLAYMGYYNNPKVFPVIGYTAFEDRPDTPQKKADYPILPGNPLFVHTGTDIPEEVEELSADIIIVGSGAGGAILAHSLLKNKPGLRIIMLERGDHTDSSQMSSDEIDMLSRLYADGALQLSRDFNFQILQGSCVGGTTVINNAVSFDIPQDVLKKWNDPQLLDAGIDEAALAQSYLYIRNLVGINKQDEASHKFSFLNKGSAPFVQGIKNLRLDNPPSDFSVVEANIKECYGCGYCNIGCKYGKKLSMLYQVLPDIQKDYGTDALKIIAGFEVDKLHAKGKTITKVSGRFKDGRKINVSAEKIVLSAGAISSSLILLKSNAGNDQVGKHLGFNLGSPITAIFDKPVNAFEGLQISHYLVQKPSQGYVMETWFNPPVAQALTMPGWFDDHFNNMLRYNRLSCVGILVPTESNAVVRDGGLFRRDIKYVPTENDLKKLGEGLILGAEIFLAGGAKAVMPHTMDFLELTKDELTVIRKKVLEEGQMTLGTGHPQGGNKMCRKPEQGVIDPHFKVYGYDNLFICDASVFPCSIGVNPQLTVMALAHYASTFIAQ
jgi:choline dehydrogenase-like flavoprotein